MSAAPLVTIAICTFNRCESLAATLACLLAQRRVEASDFETLIVDNNSTDLTREIVEVFSCGAPLRLARETRQGLSFARNRALEQARGAWVVFCDDDVRLESLWLSAWIAALRPRQGFAYAGGRVLPDWDGPPPRWFRGEKLAMLDGALVWFDLGETVRRFAADDPTPFGANMAVRRDYALGLNGFRVDLGVKGRSLGRGEETDFFLRARRRGAEGLYVGTAVCRHRVSPERFRLPSLFRYGFASGRAHRAIIDPRASGSYAASFGFLARGGLQALKGRGDRLRQCVINAGVEAALAGDVVGEAP